MPAETERKPSDPTADQPTPSDQQNEPSTPAPKKRGRLGRLLRKKDAGTDTDAQDHAPVDDQDHADQDDAADAEQDHADQDHAADAEQDQAAVDDQVADEGAAAHADEGAAAHADEARRTADTDEPHATAEADEPRAAEVTTTEPPATARRVWRCSRSTIVLVIILMVLVGLAVPAAAALSLWLGVTGFGDQQVLVLSVLGGLALLTLFFGWRLALHPRLIADGADLTVLNPFRKHRLDFADITRFAPGGDGLVIGTQQTEIAAWCVQKTTGAIKAERHTRADTVTDELWKIRDGYHRVVEDQPDEPYPAEIRFAHHEDADLLTELERSASLARLGHIFPADRYGFPEDDVRERWRSVLDDRTRQTMIADVDGEPAGYVSIGIETVHHLGVAEGFQRRGIGSELLAAGEEELFADVSLPEAELWVLEDNEVARTFYQDHGWTESGHERDAEFPPYPLEIRMVRRNPHRARRGR